MTTSFTATINSLGNSAFGDDREAEVARLLREVAKRVEDGAESGTIKDINGNTVGEFSFSFLGD